MLHQLNCKSIFRKRNRRSFTLLELMIALSLLALIGVATVSQIYGVVQTYRFESGVSALYRKIQEVRVIALTYGSDVTLTLDHKKSAFAYTFSSLEQKAPLSRTEHLLPGVTCVRIGGHPLKGSATLRITGSGRIEPAIQIEILESDSPKIGFLIDCTTQGHIQCRRWDPSSTYSDLK